MTPERWQRMNDVFHSALELAPEDTARFLDEACADDPDMLAEVRRMLAQHSRSGPLDRPCWQPESDEPSLFEPGDVLAERWRILRFVSRGGMGEVYEAEDLLMHERRALKTLLPAIAADARMIARFKQEIALSRKVPHPGVCRAFDLAVHSTPGGTPVYFLTMEFLAGETLAARLRQGPLEPGLARGLLEQVAAALSAAHQAGVIHRDLKPSNIMLVPDGGSLRAIITDFGLARGLERSGATMTGPSGLMGTFDYMAPELLAGVPASIQSDIFALGRLAARMLPDEPAWKPAIARACDPDPARRFASVSAFQAGLQARPLLRRSLIAVALAAVAMPVIWWATSSRPPSAAAAATLIRGIDLLHAGAYYAAMQSLEQATRLAPDFAPAHARLAEAWLELGIPERAKDEMLVARRVGLSGLADSERRVVEAVDFTVARNFPAAVAALEKAGDLDRGRAFERARNQKLALGCYRRAAAANPNDAAAWLRLAVLHSLNGSTEESTRAFERSAGLFRSEKNLEGLIAVEFQRGVAAMRRNRYEEAAPALENALATARLAGNLQQQIAATLQIANLSYATGDAARAEKLAGEALQLARANQMELLSISGLLNLGGAAQRKREYAVAEGHFREALTLARRLGGHRLAAAANLNLASLFGQMQDFARVTPPAEEALNFYRAENYVLESLQCLSALGRARRTLGDYPGSRNAFEEAVALAERTKEPAYLSDAHADLGSLFAAMGQLPESLAHCEKNLALAVKPEDKGYGALRTGDLLVQLGRFAAAEARLAQAEAAAHDFPDLALKTARVRAELALIRGDAARAATLARRALTTVKPAETGLAGELKRILALAALQQGGRAAARRYVSESLAAAEQIHDAAGTRAALLAAARVRLESADSAGVTALLEPRLETFADPESRWRALALLALAAPRFRQPARQSLQELQKGWGEAAAMYLARPDMESLARPLLKPDSATVSRRQ